MTYMKWIFVAAGIVGLLSMSDSMAWAKSPGGGSHVCWVKSPGAGATTIHGTVAINHLIPARTGERATVEVLARLERGNALGFFRLHLFESIINFTREDLACKIFNPGDNSDPDEAARVQTFVNEILTFFFGENHSQTSLVITDTSISNAEQGPGTVLEPIPYPGLMQERVPGNDCVVLDGKEYCVVLYEDVNDAGGMADIKLYAK